MLGASVLVLYADADLAESKIFCTYIGAHFTLPYMFRFLDGPSVFSWKLRSSPLPLPTSMGFLDPAETLEYQYTRWGVISAANQSRAS